jgi:hypothetical protein
MVRRIGDYESRTEEYEIVFSVGPSSGGLKIKYQAARAYEINAALDAAVGTAREAISDDDPDQRGPTDEALTKFSWRAIQAAKYEEGEPVNSRLEY